MNDTPEVIATRERHVRHVYRLPGLEPIIGQHVHLGHDTFLDCRNQITIGDDAFFGMRCMILTGTHDYMQFGAARRLAVSSRPVVIGEGAWIGSGAIVCPGVTVGAHAVVAAGAVVFRNVAPYTLVAGNPARKIRKLR